ncbi:hypothetical protein J2S31_000885 [Nitrospina gracilis Nb-211]|nr:hypothetical protein [Nitrospina gracilis Nb-211]
MLVLYKTPSCKGKVPDEKNEKNITSPLNDKKTTV